MSRKHRTGLKGYELALVRVILLLGIYLFVCQVLLLEKETIKVGRGRPSVFRRAEEPIGYWFFTGMTFAPVLALSTALVWSFYPPFRVPAKPGRRGASKQA